MEDECEALYYYQQAANQGHEMSRLMVNRISKEQEMAKVLEDTSPLIASPFNPNQSERTSNQSGKDLDHVTG